MRIDTRSGKATLAREARLSLRAAKIGLGQSLEQRPRVASRLEGTRRACRTTRFRVRSVCADLVSGDPYLDTARVFHVPVSALVGRTQLPPWYRLSRHPGAVMGGDWDQAPYFFEESPYWVEFREALEGERPWAETESFRARMEVAESETSAWRRRIMVAEALRVHRRYEDLYESMRTSGCLSQSELARRGGRGYEPASVDDISIGIGRTGQLLLCEGGHRVEVARALGCRTVPVWVALRHPEWWAFRQRVVAYAAGHRGGLPEQLLHPDIDTIPVSYDCRTRFDTVSAALSSGRGPLLDVSPGWGYFLHRFEALGFDCTAVAPPRFAENRYFLNKLRAASDRHFNVVDDVQSVVVPTEEPVAALLLLRDTDWWLSTATAREALSTLLVSARPRHVFVEDPTADRNGLVGSDPQSCSSEAVRFCAAAAGLQHVEVLGVSGANPLFHLSETPGTGKTPVQVG